MLAGVRARALVQGVVDLGLGLLVGITGIWPREFVDGLSAPVKGGQIADKGIPEGLRERFCVLPGDLEKFAVLKHPVQPQLIAPGEGWG